MVDVLIPAPPPGTRFGRGTVIKEVRLTQGNGKTARGLQLECDCGTVFETCLFNITNGKTQSCGCLRRDQVAAKNKTPEARERARTLSEPRVPTPPPGTRFGRGTVIEEVRLTRGNGSAVRGLRLKCDCGTVYDALFDNVIREKSRSCGCLRRELAVAKNQTPEARARPRLGTLTHGLRNHYLYQTWSNIKKKCDNPADRNYYWYGKRGITLCERWHDVRLFIEDIEAEIGPRPPGLTLDRIDNDGNYESGNVRWTTRAEQVHNS